MKNLDKIKGVVSSAVLLGATVLTASSASAAELTSLSVTPSDSRPSATAVEYDFDMAGVTTSGNTSCVTFAFNTLANGTGSFPTGMNVSGASLDNAKSNLLTTPSSWTTTVVSNVIQVQFNSNSGTVTGNTGHIVVDNIVNSSVAGSYYVTINTYSANNCTGAVDNGQTALVISDSSLASVDVEPTFTMSIQGQPSGTNCSGVASTATTSATSVPFGKVNAGNFGVAVQNVRISSNAPGGFLVYLRSTGVMTAAGGTIADFASNTPAAFPASTTAAFGFTSGDANLTTPFGANQWAGNMATVAAPGHAVSRGPSNVTYTADDTCVGYRVNIAETTKSGTYITNLVYTGVPTF